MATMRALVTVTPSSGVTRTHPLIPGIAFLDGRETVVRCGGVTKIVPDLAQVDERRAASATYVVSAVIVDGCRARRLTQPPARKALRCS